MTKTNPLITDLITFLDRSPTAWHAAELVTSRLQKRGFTELFEAEKWELKPGKGYFVVRNGSSVCAFIVPKKAPARAHILASHTDSPALKLKPHAEWERENMIMLGVEVYGSPLLNSWLNHDLGIAGKVVFRDRTKKTQQTLVDIRDIPLTIPQLAVHLDRDLREKGLKLNPQEHLSALAGLKKAKDKPYLETVLKREIKFTSLLSHDLFLYPLTPSSLTGYHNEMISGYRLDNLSSVHASLQALTETKKTSPETLKVAVFWDHEEVGSKTVQGAASPFLSQTLERITANFGEIREGYFQFLAKSLCISIDGAHGFHPNHPDRHDPQHRPLLEKGIVLKTNAQQRYASAPEVAASITDLCQNEKIPLQHFVNRSDMPCGSTVGPQNASITGIQTIDLGIPQLSMHSTREIISCQDYINLCKLLKTIFNSNGRCM